MNGVALSVRHRWFAAAVRLTPAGLDQHHALAEGPPVPAAEAHGHRLGPVGLAAEAFGTGPTKPELELLQATAAHVGQSDRSAGGGLLGGIAFPSSF